MTYLRIVLMLVTLLAVFLFGVWLTQPSFPTNRKFVAVSLNGISFVSRGLSRAPTLQVVRNSMFSFGADGFTGCNRWSGTIMLTGTRWIRFRDVATTTLACPAMMEIDRKFSTALINVTRWRTEGGILILENDTDAIRFYLAPR